MLSSFLFHFHGLSNDLDDIFSKVITRARPYRRDSHRISITNINVKQRLFTRNLPQGVHQDMSVESIEPAKKRGAHETQLQKRIDFAN